MTTTDDLDRLPTQFERFLGAAASLLIFLILGLIVAVGTYLSLHRSNPVPTAVIVILSALVILALWAAHMFVRIVRGTPKKPSPLAQIIIGLIATVGGIAYLIALVAGAIPSSPKDYWPAMFAAMILVSGLAWSRHAWKKLRAHEA